MTVEGLMVEEAVAEVSGPFVTVAEVASRMRVSKMTVYRLVHSGELPAIRFGRSFRVQQRAVEELIHDAQVRTDPSDPLTSIEDRVPMQSGG
jgi:excisionase family DNA binding protein